MHKFYKLYGRILAESLAEGRRPAFCSIEASIEAACSPACTEMSNGEIGTIIQQLLLHSYSGTILKSIIFTKNF